MQSYAAGKAQSGLTAESFALLLQWLSPDREDAGRKYEQIRRGLIKIFSCRGCPVAEELADETINRVITKIAQIAGDYDGDPARYFYAVADKIYLEYQRKARQFAVPLQGDFPARKESTDEREARHECLERCMERLPEHSRELILVYYGYDSTGKEKIERRKQLAETMGIPASALWLRAHRIRESLKKCARECFQSSVEK